MGAEPYPAAMKLDGDAAGRSERRPVRLRALGIRTDGSTCDISVLDLSYEGCGIDTSGELEPGERIKLSVLGRGAIDACVRWYKDGRAGLVFAAPKPERKAHSPRQSERIALGADVSLRRLGQNNYRLRVTDLSPEGCKVDLVERPRIDECMLVKFDGLEVLDAQVIWVEGFVAGLRFEKSIHPAVFDLLLHRLVPAGRAA
jgi:PilZ domain